MAHQHDTHNSNEKKPVAFTVPLICGLVAVLIILLFVSLGDPCRGNECCENGESCSKECMEACEKGDHTMHPSGMKHEAGHQGHEAKAAEGHEHATEAAAPASDSTKTEAPAEHKEEGHH
jgi:hypothetical protein